MTTKTRHTPQPRIAAILAFCVVIALFFGLESLESQRYRQTLQTRTINGLSQIRAGLETEINANFYLTRGLIAFISTHPEMDDQTFQKLSRQILKHHNYIRNIAIAPDNTVRFVYPLQGNEKALGLKYKNNPEQWPAVERAILSRKTVVAGPVKLVQGGYGFISRTQIYIEGDSGKPTEAQYWGLASIVIEKERLFQAAGFYDANLDIDMAVRGKDGLGAEGELFEGDPAIFLNQPVLLPVNLPEGSWQLAAVPKGGWNAPSPNLAVLRSIGLLLALLISWATFSWLRRQESIKISLEAAWREAQTTQTILRQNEDFLNTVIDNLPAMLFVKDAENLRYARFNRTGAELLGYSPEELLGKTDFDFFPESEARFFREKDREVLSRRILLDIPEESVQTRNQGSKILHTRKIPIFDQQGKPLYLLGIS